MIVGRGVEKVCAAASIRNTQLAGTRPLRLSSVGSVIGRSKAGMHSAPTALGLVNASPMAGDSSPRRSTKDFDIAPQSVIAVCPFLRDGCGRCRGVLIAIGQ